MAVQSSIYATDGSTRTFPSTKHIATKQHVAVRAKRVLDNAWEYIEPEIFNLVNNSIVFLTAPATSIYSQLEVRVADDYDELESTPNDISAVAQYLDEIATVADNIDSIISASNGEYLTYGLPTTANIGDISVDTLTGGIYQWDGDSWELVAQSGSSPSDVVPLGVNIVTGLPTVGANGEIVFNEADGYFYGYINGTWTQMISTPTTTDQVGIEVVTTDPTVDNYEGRVVFNTTDNQLKKYTAGVWLQVVEPTTAAATVADGSLTTAAFAATIRPVEIFDTLPTTGNSVGRLVYLTIDGQLYRYTSIGFSTAVPTTALTGTISSTQIGANQITTGSLAVGAVTADTIAANAITTDKISSNSITTGMIQAGAIGATQIATNAITADKVNAGAITAGKIAALSIDATKIIAGSIGADQLAANSITAGKLAAGSVSANNIVSGTITATQIATGTITANQLAAYSVTADKIQTGSITVDKLTSSSSNFSGAVFGLGSGASVAGYTGAGYFISNVTNKFGMLSFNNTTGYGFGASCVNGSGAAILINAKTTSHSSWNTLVELANVNHAGYFNNTNSNKTMFIATNTYAYQTGGGLVGSFTGGHDGLILKSLELPEIGDIMVDRYVYAVKDMDDSMCVNDVSTISHQKNVVGVYNGNSHSSHVPTSVSKSVTNKNSTTELVIDTSKYSDLNEYYMIVISALGEGLINVCGTNGNIEAGDLITSSSIKGKGMKQDSDVVCSYTVAKARGGVTFDYPEQVKQIACIYMCG